MYQMDDIDDAFLSGKKWNLVYKSAGQQTKKFTDILLYNFSKTTSSYNNNKKTRNRWKYSCKNKIQFVVLFYF